MYLMVGRPVVLWVACDAIQSLPIDRHGDDLYQITLFERARVEQRDVPTRGFASAVTCEYSKLKRELQPRSTDSQAISYAASGFAKAICA